MYKKSLMKIPKIPKNQ